MQLEKTSGHAVLWWLDLMETLQGRERWSWAPRERVLWLLLGEGGGGNCLWFLICLSPSLTLAPPEPTWRRRQTWRSVLPCGGSRRSRAWRGVNNCWWLACGWGTWVHLGDEALAMWPREACFAGDTGDRAVADPTGQRCCVWQARAWLSPLSVSSAEGAFAFPALCY